MDEIAVFLGPTLCKSSAARQLDALFLPPAACGDIHRVAITLRPAAIALIDGYFSWTPAVFHKEILFALESGIRVFGASSMGALRAAELAPFGMQGVGHVYSMFASGELEDDDEVAVTHAPMELGFEPLSAAMVDIRHRLTDAVHKSVLSASHGAHLIAYAKRLHFSERLWTSICKEGARIGADEKDLDRFLEAAGPTLKQIDAVALLSRMRRWQALNSWPRAPRPVRMHRTSYWLRFTSRAGHPGKSVGFP